MPAIILLGVEDLKKYRQISENLSTPEQLEPYILDAQNLDVKPGLGNAFFTDMAKNRTAVKYTLLLNGGEYTNSEGKTLTFEGIRAALAHFAHSRYILSRNIQDTPFGAIRRNNDYGEPANAKDLERLSNQSRQIGLAYYEEALDFIRVVTAAGSTDYALFAENSCRETSRPAAPFVLTKIG